MKQVTAQDLLQRCKAIVEGAHPQPLPFWVDADHSSSTGLGAPEPEEWEEYYTLLYEKPGTADHGVNQLLEIGPDMPPLDLQLAVRILNMDVGEAKQEGVHLSTKEANMVARLLGMASDEFSNHGCNDLPDDFWDDWTRLERQALHKAIQEDNGTPEDYDPDHLELPDWLLMDYVRDRLRGLAPLPEAMEVPNYDLLISKAAQDYGAMPFPELLAELSYLENNRQRMLDEVPGIDPSILEVANENLHTEIMRRVSLVTGLGTKYLSEEMSHLKRQFMALNEPIPMPKVLTMLGHLANMEESVAKLPEDIRADLSGQVLG